MQFNKCGIKETDCIWKWKFSANFSMIRKVMIIHQIGGFSPKKYQASNPFYPRNLNKNCWKRISSKAWVSPHSSQFSSEFEVPIGTQKYHSNPLIIWWLDTQSRHEFVGWMFLPRVQSNPTMAWVHDDFHVWTSIRSPKFLVTWGMFYDWVYLLKPM